MISKLGRQMHKEQMELMDKENEALEIRAKYDYEEPKKPFLSRFGSFLLKGGLAVAVIFDN